MLFQFLVNNRIWRYFRWSISSNWYLVILFMLCQSCYVMLCYVTRHRLHWLRVICYFACMRACYTDAPLSSYSRLYKECSSSNYYLINSFSALFPYVPKSTKILWKWGKIQLQELWFLCHRSSLNRILIKNVDIWDWGLPERILWSRAPSSEYHDRERHLANTTIESAI